MPVHQLIFHSIPLLPLSPSFIWYAQHAVPFATWTYLLYFQLAIFQLLSYHVRRNCIVCILLSHRASQVILWAFNFLHHTNYWRVCLTFRSLCCVESFSTLISQPYYLLEYPLPLPNQQCEKNSLMCQVLQACHGFQSQDHTQSNFPPQWCPWQGRPNRSLPHVFFFF